MKLVKTIVATAVIVFALTTVAMAGVQRLGHEEEAAAGTVQAQPAAAGAVAQHAGSVTLSARQFAALLRVAAHDGDRDRVEKKTHQRSSTRTHAQAKAQTHTATHAQTHTATHAQTHSGAHDGGTHDGGTHHDGGHD